MRFEETLTSSEKKEKVDWTRDLYTDLHSRLSNLERRLLKDIDSDPDTSDPILTLSKPNEQEALSVIEDDFNNMEQAIILEEVRTLKEESVVPNTSTNVYDNENYFRIIITTDEGDKIDIIPRYTKFQGSDNCSEINFETSEPENGIEIINLPGLPSDSMEIKKFLITFAEYLKIEFLKNKDKLLSDDLSVSINFQEDLRNTVMEIYNNFMKEKTKEKQTK